MFRQCVEILGPKSTMRTVYTTTAACVALALFLAFLFSGKASGAEPTPQFTVVNRMPFVVVNRMPARAVPAERPFSGTGTSARNVVGARWTAPYGATNCGPVG
jgi:hypothetical protein